MVADLTAQMLIAGTWTKVPILTRDGFTITRLGQNQASRVDAGSCRLSLRNRDGAFSDRNPRSPYAGQLGKNTQLRATVPDTTHLYVPGAGACSATPDHASLDITGDLDLRADIQPEVWDTTNGFGIADKYLTTGNQRSWAWYINYQRRPMFRWSPDGTIASAITVTSSAPVPVSGDGRTRLRVTLRPSFGGSYHVHFYVGDTITGPWTLLGNGWVGAPSSLFAGTAQLRVGNDSAGALGLDRFIGRVHAFQMRSGLDGTIVANPGFTAQPVGTAPFADSAGRTWSHVDAEIRDFDVRFHGEVASWPIRWNVSGKDIWAPLAASGILRRLSRPKSPLRSALSGPARPSAAPPA